MRIVSMCIYRYIYIHIYACIFMLKKTNEEYIYIFFYLYEYCSLLECIKNSQSAK